MAPSQLRYHRSSRRGGKKKPYWRQPNWSRGKLLSRPEVSGRMSLSWIEYCEKRLGGVNSLILLQWISIMLCMCVSCSLLCLIHVVCIIFNYNYNRLFVWFLKKQQAATFHRIHIVWPIANIASSQHLQQKVTTKLHTINRFTKHARRGLYTQRLLWFRESASERAWSQISRAPRGRR